MSETKGIKLFVVVVDVYYMTEKLQTSSHQLALSVYYDRAVFI